MPKVFISHAAADKPLVDAVHAMVQGAIGLQPGKELFYSSGAGTGVLAGKNFVQYIRDEMDGWTFVVAVITPSFVQSAFCLAELGAIWMAADAKSFFPICVPSVDRGDLSATLTGIHVERLDERPALAQLLQRVSEHFGRDYNAAAGDAHITAFQAQLPALLKKLATPRLVPAADLQAAEAAIETLGQQVVEARAEATREKSRADEILAARNLEEAEERARALPDDTKKALDELVQAARDAIRKVPGVVADAVPYALKGEDMPWPDPGRLRPCGDAPAGRRWSTPRQRGGHRRVGHELPRRERRR